jgi:hypothetical protein
MSKVSRVHPLIFTLKYGPVSESVLYVQFRHYDLTLPKQLSETPNTAAALQLSTVVVVLLLYWWYDTQHWVEIQCARGG